ncbi:GNAT family N-acetyltransferase [Pseudochrobactrum lubricantis]|uniref:GNAT family N-acetyltransferase n=1 Tax=Pseudochrobactrum lubricantis TaxID=558172 RepID=UPI0035DBC3B7
MSEVTIRQLVPDDFAIMREIRLEALQLHPEAYSSAYEDWVKFSEADWRAKLSTPVFAAFDGERPVGLIGLWPQAGARTAHRAIVVMVYVKSEMRGQGIAQKLMQVVEAYARDNGFTQLELSVLAENKTAWQLYLREGYTEFGRRPNWISLNGEMFDEVMMLRSVAENA